MLKRYTCRHCDRTVEAEKAPADWAPYFYELDLCLLYTCDLCQSPAAPLLEPLDDEDTLPNLDPEWQSYS